MDEQKKSDCMAQKKKKPASGSTGKKKNERASERAKLRTDKRMKDKTLPEKSWGSSA